MVRLLNDFTVVCTTSETGDDFCSCDFRINIYGCLYSDFYVTSGKVLVSLCILLAIISSGFLIYLTKFKKQPFFLPASKERGWLRPRPLHSYHLIVLNYTFFEAIHLIAIVNELYPNVKTAEIGNIMMNIAAGSVAVFYTVSIVYSTPKVKFNENYEALNRKKGLNKRFVDIIAIILFLQPIFTWIPLALMTGHFAEIDDTKTASLFFTAHYLTIVTWEVIYVTVLAYFWYKLMSVINGYIKVLEERNTSSGISDGSHIERIKSSTRNITLPVVAIVVGLFFQAIIFTVMGLTHRSNTFHIFGWNVFYYWIQYAAFPIIGLFVEGFLTYQTLKNLRKPPQESHSSSYSSSEQTRNE